MAFTPFSYKAAAVIGMAAAAGLGLFLFKYMGLATALVVSPTALIVITFIDYFAFSGISTRREKCMEMMKSSVYGSEIIGKTLKTDIRIKIVTLLLSFSGCIAGTFIYESGLLFILAVMAATAAVTGLTVIFSRRKGLSLMVHTMIIYIATNMLEGVLLILLLCLTATGRNEDVPVPAGWVTALVGAVLALIAVLIGWLMYRDSVKGYESGFCDNSETAEMMKRGAEG